MGLVIDDGGLVVQDLSDQSVYVFDWDARHLAAGVAIASSSFTITPVQPSDDTALVKDNVGFLSGNRKTTLRLSGGTSGALYEIANKIVTDEAVPQTKERSFLLLIKK